MPSVAAERSLVAHLAGAARARGLARRRERDVARNGRDFLFLERAL